MNKIKIEKYCCQAQSQSWFTGKKNWDRKKLTTLSLYCTCFVFPSTWATPTTWQGPGSPLLCPLADHRGSRAALCPLHSTRGWEVSLVGHFWPWQIPTVPYMVNFSYNLSFWLLFCFKLLCPRLSTPGWEVSLVGHFWPRPIPTVPYRVNIFLKTILFLVYFWGVNIS